MSDVKRQFDNALALVTWQHDCGTRPEQRPDGWPTRSDLQWFSEAEWAIHRAMGAVESAGGSVALTDAITLLAKAKARVADHVEGKP
jgi:hypothetical protein